MAHERILVVDDEPGVRGALEGILRDEGFDVATATSGEEGLKELSGGGFDAVLLDVWLPGVDGIETLMELRDRGIDAEVVMISGHGTIDTAVRATKLGAFDFIEKPLSLERILLVLRNALRQRRLERRNRRLLEQLDRDTEVLGSSPAVAMVRRRIAAAAGTDAPVLLCGEPGSGRETAARRIHASGPRSGEAFVAVSCPALDTLAAERALFGEPGRQGLIALAEHGSLFLDEADRLDPSLQSRLAAVFDRRREDAPDVRLLASTGPDPAIVEPSLRRRLEVMRIDITPLRERREDIPVLAHRFMRDLSREYGRPEKVLDRDSLQALTTYPWPGNVRELRDLLEGLLVLSPGDVVSVRDLPERLGGARGPTEDLYREFASLADGLLTFERYYIRRVLTEERGSRGNAAQRLALEPDALERRIQKLGLG